MRQTIFRIFTSLLLLTVISWPLSSYGHTACDLDSSCTNLDDVLLKTITKYPADPKIMVTASGVTLIEMWGGWTMDPFQSGYSVLELHASTTYGKVANLAGVAGMPELPLSGHVTIPVFLIDWNDFDPITDPSNPSNPGSVYGPTYVQKTPLEFDDYLNGPHGPAAYYEESSGGQMTVSFDVHGWIESDSSQYIDDHASYYYLRPDSSGYLRDPGRLINDILRTAIADLGLDLNQYDSDQNGAIDGFVTVYEGQAGFVLSTQLYNANPAYYGDPWYRKPMENIAELVDASDPNYSLFQAQPLLYCRSVAIPELTSPGSGGFRAVGTWVHELGHLWLGFRDYYIGSTTLSSFALSGSYGGGHPHQPSASEKYLFGHWIDFEEIAQSGIFSIRNSNIVSPNPYNPGANYLYKLLIDGDPYHYLLIENRYFLSESEGGSYWNDATKPGESGLIIFEVDLHSLQSEQIKQLYPSRLTEKIKNPGLAVGAWLPDDVLDYRQGASWFRIYDVSSPGEDITFTVSFDPVSSLKVTIPTPPSSESTPFPITVEVVDSNSSVIPSLNETFVITAWQGGSGKLATLGPQGSTSSRPLSTGSPQNREQFIYFADEIGEGGVLTSLALNVTVPPADTIPHWTIRMKHTTQSEFTTAEWDTGFSRVFSGDVLIEQPGWTTFLFQTPFVYNGLENLMIDFSHDGDKTSTGGWVGAANAVTNRQLRLAVGGELGSDPTTWIGSTPLSKVAKRVPDIKLQLGHSIPITTIPPAQFLAGSWSGSVSLSSIEPMPYLRIELASGVDTVIDLSNIPTAVRDRNPHLPTEHALFQNTPNPFNPQTTIRYAIADEWTDVTLRIFDVRGRVVRTLVNQQQRGNIYNVTWDGKSDRGQLVASGIYFYRLKAGKKTLTKKMVLLK